MFSNLQEIIYVYTFVFLYTLFILCANLAKLVCWTFIVCSISYIKHMLIVSIVLDFLEMGTFKKCRRVCLAWSSIEFLSYWGGDEGLDGDGVWWGRELRRCSGKSEQV